MDYLWRGKPFAYYSNECLTNVFSPAFINYLWSEQRFSTVINGVQISTGSFIERAKTSVKVFYRKILCFLFWFFYVIIKNKRTRFNKAEKSKCLISRYAIRWITSFTRRMELSVNYHDLITFFSFHWLRKRNVFSIFRYHWLKWNCQKRFQCDFKTIRTEKVFG